MMIDAPESVVRTLPQPGAGVIKRSQSINALVAEIDANRGGANLSSAIRVFLLESVIQ